MLPNPCEVMDEPAAVVRGEVVRGERKSIHDLVAGEAVWGGRRVVDESAAVVRG